ncbi:protein suex-1 [Drosophila biarmipes]|uniref:protein suex-1 n=1 Tax=Drosophila biarmipes TaxID=125945 RepID=UPI0007E8520C|nr:protein suex-1 [Drosophila biarmipes]
MYLVFLATFLLLLGGVLTHPEEEDLTSAATLDDVADLGGQEAKEGGRPARWLSGGWGGGWNTGWNGGWGGGWNGGWNKGWSVSYRPWSYSSYWW